MPLYVSQIMLFLVESKPNTFFSEMLTQGSLSVDDAVDFAVELFIAGVESVS